MKNPPKTAKAYAQRIFHWTATRNIPMSVTDTHLSDIQIKAFMAGVKYQREHSSGEVKS